MNFNDITIQRKTCFDDFHDPYLYQFGHRFLIRCGIDLGSILITVWHEILCSPNRLFDDFGDQNFIAFDQKLDQPIDEQVSQFHHFLRTLFRTLLPFTIVRPTSATNHFFHFSTIKKNLSTLLPYTLVRPTSAS